MKFLNQDLTTGFVKRLNDVKTVLIINSPLFRECNPLYDEDSLPPIGLGYIATALRNKGVNIDLIDTVAKNIPLSELVATVEEKAPDFVAINVFTTNFNLVKEFVEAINNPDIRFIVGGLSTRTLYKNIFNWQTNNYIYVVFGDGELITLDIVNNEIHEVPFYERKNRRFYKVNKYSSYYLHDISNVPLDRRLFVNEPLQHPLGFIEAHIITSRGCIYDCTYCAAARSLNKDMSIRENTTESIIEELYNIKSVFPRVSSIRVLDDLFLKNLSNINKAIKLFSILEYSWRSMAHITTFIGVNNKTMDELKASGCSELFIGIESGSTDVLKRIHKTYDIGMVKKSLSKAFKAGISVKGYFIFGFPGETVSDFENTYRLAMYLKEQSLVHNVRFRTSVFQFRPYHGTALYQELEKKHSGKIKPSLNFIPDIQLSELVGRSQYNFISGNYSCEDDSTIHDYIYRTIKLNDILPEGCYDVS